LPFFINNDVDNKHNVQAMGLSTGLRKQQGRCDESKAYS